jgi:HEAT repeat protein
MIALSVVVYAVVALALTVAAITGFVLLREHASKRLSSADRQRIAEVRRIVDTDGRPVDALAADLVGRYSARVLERAIVEAAGENAARTGDRLPKLASALGLVDRYVRIVREASSWSERAHAATVLGLLGVAAAVPALLAALRDPHEDVTVKEAAAEALGRVRDPAAVAVLIDELRQVDEFSSPRVAAALAAFGAQAIEPLRGALAQADNPTTRSWATRVLGMIGDASATAALVERLADPHEQVRASAAEALGRLGGARALQPLVDRALRDPTPHVRSEAAAALGRLGEVAAIDALAAALDDPNYDTRIRALEAVETIRPADLLPLERALRNPSVEVRRRAALALERVGFLDARVAELASDAAPVRARAVEAIVELGRVGLVDGIAAFLASTDGRVRAGLAAALGEIGDVKAHAALVGVASDPEPAVRAEVASALGKLRAPDASATLAKLLGDGDVAVCEAAASALASFDANELLPVLDALHAAFGHRSPRVRARVVEAAAKVDAAPSVRIVLRASEDPSEEVRSAAVSLIPRVLERTSIEPLVSRLRDPSLEVQIAAVDALAALPAHQQTTEILLHALAGAAPEVRDRIAAALARDGGEALHERLRSLSSSGDLDVRLGIAWTLGKSGAPAGVPILAQLVSDMDPQLRASAAGALGKIADPRAVEALLGAASDPDPRVRAAAINGLGKIGEGARAAGELLASRLDDPDAFVRNRAAIALARVRPSDALAGLVAAEARGALDEAVLHIALALVDAEPARVRVAKALGDAATLGKVRAQLGREDEATQRAFYEALHLEDPADAPSPLSAAKIRAHYDHRLRVSQSAESREWAVEALAKMASDQSVDALADALGCDPVVAVRVRAAEALGAQRGDERARAALLRAMDDPSPEVALVVARIMSSAPDHDEKEALLRRLGSEDEALAAAVEESLARAFSRDPRALAARLAQIDRPEVLEAGARVLASTGNEAAVGALSGLLSSLHVTVRAAAVKGLGDFSAPSAASALAAALEDAQELVRIAAVEALLRRESAEAFRLASTVRLDPSPSVRRALATALGRLYAPAPKNERRTLVSQLAGDPDPTVRGALLASLLEARDEDAEATFLSTWSEAAPEARRALAEDRRAQTIAEWLSTLLRQGSPRRRKAAALGLGALRAGNWGEALLPALGDPVAEVRAAAATALVDHPRADVRERVGALGADPDPIVRALAKAGSDYQRV